MFLSARDKLLNLIMSVSNTRNSKYVKICS
jgi:hypothetical protein